MFSQADDSQQRLALIVIFGLVAVIVASVITFGARHAMHRHGPAPAPVSVFNAQPPALAAPASELMKPASATVAQDTNAQYAQAASDAASVKVEQGVVKFYFASGKADLARGAREALSDVVRSAKEGRKLVISGFHDASGNAVSNAALAMQRAIVVRDALKAAGVAEVQIELKKPEQIETTGSDAEARRVEISLQ